MYRKSIWRKRYERKVAKCAAMRAAKERKRQAQLEKCGQWERVATVMLIIHAAPDGRSIALRACGGRGEWMRCGTERAVRGALARVMWQRGRRQHRRAAA